MRPESARRIFKLGVTNFWRNRWLSFAATLIMTLTLLIISFFTISTVAIGRTTDSIRSRMDVSVYFNDTASIEQIVRLQKELAARSDVKTVSYVSKEEALVACKKNPQCQKASALIDQSENPLPRSLEIKANQAEDLKNIAAYLKDSKLQTIVHNVSYQDNKTVIDRLIAITAFTREFGWLVCSVFILISILVIINTIRLTMFTRKDEIEIMRLVGANDSFIKIPFVIEGLLYGVLATFLSMATVWVGIAVLAPRTEHYLGVASSERLMSFFTHNFWSMLSLELLVGLIIGATCSLISIRKHLKI